MWYNIMNYGRYAVALVTYRRDTLVSSTLGQIATDNGFISISDAPILGAIIRAVSDALNEGYAELYDIAKNVDIGRASGGYLDRWGNLLGEPRTTVGYATDLSLTNTFISIVPSVHASQLTVDNGGILIPGGTVLSSADGTYNVVTIGDSQILPDRDRTFVKVIATDTSVTEIPAGVLSIVQLSFAQIPNVVANASKLYKLAAFNQLPITGGRGIADDELYRYILKESTQSVWLFNDARIRKLLDILQVRQVIIDEYRGGVVVYIETTEPSVSEQVAAIAKTHLSSEKPCGLSLTVSPVIYRYLRLWLTATFSTGDVSQLASLKSQFANAIGEQINARYAGEAIDLQEAVATAAGTINDLESYSIQNATVDGRTLLQYAVPQRLNQKLYLDPTFVTFA